MTGLPATSDDPASGAWQELALELSPLEIRALAAWEERWRALERRCTDPSAFVTFDWLRAWAHVYRPRSLLIAHGVAREDGATAALGLIDVDRIRGWRFAGGAVTPQRAPLCLDGTADAVWGELGGWLRGNASSWSSLEACGVEHAAGGLPGARLSDAAAQCLPLPDSFEGYLATLPGKRRQEARRRLRRSEEEGVTVSAVPVEETEAAYTDFLALSALRPEIRKNHDDSLIELLHAIDRCGAIEVHLFEVRENDTRIGVSVDLIHGRVYYPYVLAWDPGRSELSPGILLALNAIEQAIEQGLSTINLGPGAQDYKRSLGFLPGSGLTLEALNPAVPGRALRALGSAYQRVRANPRASPK